jgi:RNA-binding protein 25
MASTSVTLETLLKTLDPQAPSLNPNNDGIKPKLNGTMYHLQDLGPEDLPEESRGLITREIAFFR